MYDSQLVPVYELIYRARGKDWAAEAEHVARLIRDRNPAAASLLDVACGTGAHLLRFADLFGHLAGLEISTPMREVAERRLPSVPLHAGDMRSFDLHRTFDAVTCMFVAISLVGDRTQMRASVAAMARHLNRGGVLVIEPWWFPDRFIDGYVAGDLVRENGRTVTRISHSTRQGGATRMEAKYVIGEATGITEFTEIDVLSLFSREEYTAAFRDAGCSVEYLAGYPSDRGLFVGVRG
jgi:dTDP-3-amino-3,4,6-trideoxy-alpha-D-glucopyranose N,N-dimethyltransferase